MTLVGWAKRFLKPTPTTVHTPPAQNDPESETNCYKGNRAGVSHIAECSDELFIDGRRLDSLETSRSLDLYKSEHRKERKKKEKMSFSNA